VPLAVQKHEEHVESVGLERSDTVGASEMMAMRTAAGIDESFIDATYI
jgi:hypothetical protein